MAWLVLQAGEKVGVRSIIAEVETGVNRVRREAGKIGICVSSLRNRFSEAPEGRLLAKTVSLLATRPHVVPVSRPVRQGG